MGAHIYRYCNVQCDLSFNPSYFFEIQYRWLSSKASAPTDSKSTFVEKFISQQPETSARWPKFLCVCSVSQSGKVQLHWSQRPPTQNATPPKWFCTSKGLIECGPSGIIAADAIITDSGMLHVAGVLAFSPATVIVWVVLPGQGNGLEFSPKTSITTSAPLSPPNWIGFAPLPAFLFSWQDQSIPLHCSTVSNFSAYVSSEAAPSTQCCGVAGVAFDPTRGGSVIAAVVVEGKYMSPHDPDESLSITGWRVQRWESSFQPVVLNPIFGSMDGNPPMRTVWESKVDISIPATDDKSKGIHFNPFDLPKYLGTLARVVFSAQGGEIAVAFFQGRVRIFSGSNFEPVTNYEINVGSSISVPAFSATSCCSASVWHDTSKGEAMLKIIRVLPPPFPIGQEKATSSTWEHAISERFWFSLLVGVDWWDVVGCTQRAAEEGIVSVNGVIAVLDADFHSLPTAQHRQQYCLGLDMIKCRLLVGSNAQEVRATVLDMQARVLLDMLGKGIESALINPSALLPDPWQASEEILSNFDMEEMAVEPELTPCIQAYVDSVIDLASHLITRLRHYAKIFRTLANQAVTVASGSTSGGVPNLTLNPSISGPSSLMLISINTGTFPGTPAVRLIGDCHFLHRLCQLLFFCFFFKRSQLARYKSGLRRTAETSLVRSNDGQTGRDRQIVPGSKGGEEPSPGPVRLGNGNAGQGYSVEEVKVIFQVLLDLCRRTSGLQHPLPVSQVGSSNIQVQLHYIEGSYTVLPEVVEASLGPYMQNMPRLGDADDTGLLLRELQLHPPAEEWHQLNMFVRPCTDSNDTPKPFRSNPLDSRSLESNDIDYGTNGLRPKKRRMIERDAAFGLNTSLGLGAYLGIMGSRRDVITTSWKTGLEGVWYKCIRCMRQTSAFTSLGSANIPHQNERESWWVSRWAYSCPMCGGRWVRVV
ncbi:mediator of RNA polymerase II transcription subunit 16 [Medicago truncatula]|uniref:mediator of RNA polymerase II transcription subunit 16 n=1 Tax=Medicago truncatula TaxID=3880 RepID=UPI001967A714|nr:mediator of RNA polymerase II transcription subunit 16 [Medicago truncatula]